jgi:uncharacterized protein
LTFVTLSTKKTIRPPFTRSTAKRKVKAAQDLWNTRDPELVAAE